MDPINKERDGSDQAGGPQRELGLILGWLTRPGGQPRNHGVQLATNSTNGLATITCNDAASRLNCFHFAVISVAPDLWHSSLICVVTQCNREHDMFVSFTSKLWRRKWFAYPGPLLRCPQNWEEERELGVGEQIYLLTNKLLLIYKEIVVYKGIWHTRAHRQTLPRRDSIIHTPMSIHPHLHPCTSKELQHYHSSTLPPVNTVIEKRPYPSTLTIETRDIRLFNRGR